MGLDMYLYVTKHESYGSWDKDRKNPLTYPNELKELYDDILERDFTSIETKYLVGYWRKFNALHSYIINHFNDGNDNCTPIYLGYSAIEKILVVLNEVLEDLNTCEKKIEIEKGYEYITYNSKKAIELLPPQKGFFFGSQLIDEWYKEDVKYSIKLFEKVLEIEEDYTCYYEASW